MKASIRTASNQDSFAIASILNALLDTTAIEWTDKPHSRESVLAWIEEHQCVLVAEHDGEVVGVAAYGWFRDVTKRPGNRFAVENTVHVRQIHWRSGVGTALMRSLIERAQASGKHAMIAAVDGANEPSIRFHERLGFSQVAYLSEVGEKFGRWQDLVLLQLRLDQRKVPWFSSEPAVAHRSASVPHHFYVKVGRFVRLLRLDQAGQAARYPPCLFPLA
jgi:L-amino acid N-acyltransferase